MSISMVVKWAGKEYSMENIDPEATVLDLKLKIQGQTGVRPDRQKLLNLKVKGEELFVFLMESFCRSCLYFGPNFIISLTLLFRSSCYR